MKIEIQKSNSKMGIIFINSKTKIKFPSGLTFLFCEAIITQLSCFVNRRRKFFSCTHPATFSSPFADTETATFAFTQT